MEDSTECYWECYKAQITRVFIGTVENMDARACDVKDGDCIVASTCAAALWFHAVLHKREPEHHLANLAL